MKRDRASRLRGLVAANLERPQVVKRETTDRAATRAISEAIEPRKGERKVKQPKATEELEYYVDDSREIQLVRKKHTSSDLEVQKDMTNVSLFELRPEVPIDPGDMETVLAIYNNSQTVQGVTSFLKNAILGRGMYMENHEELVRRVWELENELFGFDYHAKTSKKARKETRRSVTFDNYLRKFNARVSSEWAAFVGDVMKNAICFGFVAVTMQDTSSMGAVPTCLRMETVDVSMRTDSTMARCYLTYRSKETSSLSGIDKDTLPSESTLDEMISRGVYTFFWDGRRPLANGHLTSQMMALVGDTILENMYRLISIVSAVRRANPKVFISHKKDEEASSFRSNEQLAASLTNAQSLYPNGVIPQDRLETSAMSMQQLTAVTALTNMRNSFGDMEFLGEKGILVGGKGLGAQAAQLQKKEMIQLQGAVSDLQQSMLSSTGMLSKKSKAVQNMMSELIMNNTRDIAHPDSKIEHAPVCEEPSVNLIQMLSFLEERIAMLLACPRMMWTNTSMNRTSKSTTSGPDDPANKLFRDAQGFWGQFIEGVCKRTIFIIFSGLLRRHNAAKSYKVASVHASKLDTLVASKPDNVDGLDVLACATVDVTASSSLMRLSGASHFFAVDEVIANGLKELSEIEDDDFESAIDKVTIRLTAMTPPERMDQYYELGLIKKKEYIKFLSSAYSIPIKDFEEDRISLEQMEMFNEHYNMGLIDGKAFRRVLAKFYSLPVDMFIDRPRDPGTSLDGFRAGKALLEKSKQKPAASKSKSKTK